jgi:hypothetical protein
MAPVFQPTPQPPLDMVESLRSLLRFKDSNTESYINCEKIIERYLDEREKLMGNHLRKYVFVNNKKSIRRHTILKLTDQTKNDYVCISR